jgi:aminocarboxymuconate-semialdehyde decarboxylase
LSVDFHAHLALEDPSAPPFMRSLFDVDGYLEHQAQAGIELTLLSYAPADLEGTDAELEEAKAENDFLLSLASRHSGRLAALPGIDPFGGPRWLAEAERALAAGSAGLCFPTSRQGRYLDADDAQDAFALADAHRAVVFIHPADSPITVERAGDGVLRAWIGRPYDTGICLSRMLLAGTLARYPNVRIVAAHSGGALPMLLGRLDHVYDGFQRRAAMGGAGPPGGGPPGGGPPKGPPGGAVPEEAKLRPNLEGPPPSERLGQIYLDTASYHPAAIHAAIAAVGVERVVLGSDHPPAGDSPGPSVELIRRLDIAPDARERILSGNALELLAGRAESAVH